MNLRASHGAWGGWVRFGMEGEERGRMGRGEERKHIRTGNGMGCKLY
jgi:hypothetical protein